MSDYFPAEIFIDILTRLPVKSLLRFRSVSKSWFSLITNPNFIISHTNRAISQTNTTHSLFLRLYSDIHKQERYSLRCDDTNPSFDKCSDLQCPFETRSKCYFRIVGSVNGLICLSDDYFGYTYTIILWNPSVNQSVALPRPRLTFKALGPYMFVLGFGFDPKSNDYKVVRIVYVQNEEGYEIPPEVEVYRLSTGLWGSISAPPPPYGVVEFFWSQALVNGNVHWAAFDKSGGEACFRNVVLSFDMGDEVFRAMMLPESVACGSVLTVRVAAMDESLCLIHYDEFSRSEFCSLWVMREYGVSDSWTKLFRIDLRGSELRKVVGFRKNGNVLMTRSGGELVSYDPKSRRARDLGIHGSKRAFYVGSYMESLVLLNRGGEDGAEERNRNVKESKVKLEEEGCGNSGSSTISKQEMAEMDLSEESLKFKLMTLFTYDLYRN